MKNFLQLLIIILTSFNISNVSHAQLSQDSSKKINIWDFGAEQFDIAHYNNMLDVATINGWHPSTMVAGSSSTSNKLPGNIDMGGGLSWVGNGDDSDRLRTSNTSLTRYDENVGATGVTGRVYANGSSNSGGRRYFTLTLAKGDQAIIKALSHSGGGSEFTFEHATDTSIMSETQPMPEALTEFSFTAPESGLYKFYDPTGKLSVFQILKVPTPMPKTDVWDFGAEQLDVSTYNNMLDVATINGWHPSTMVAGSSSTSNKLPGNIDMGGGLSWVGNGDDSDRLRTSNTALTRYDENVGATGVTGRVYANGSSNSGGRRYFTLTLVKGDQAIIKALSHSGGGSEFTFEHATDTSIMSETQPMPEALTEFSFTVPESGLYKFYDPTGKLSVYQIFRVPSLKTDVWDFGAEQLDVSTYNNMLDVATINGWHPSTMVAGSNGNKFPGNIDMGGGLSWVGNGDDSDRLRTSNTALTRYDENVGATGVTGRVYANGSSNSGGRRYFTLTLAKGDQAIIKALSHSGGGSEFTFEHATDTSIMSVTKSMPEALTEYTFTAPELGQYKFYDPSGKLSVYQVFRKPAALVISVDIWDFGAEQFDSSKFNNRLSEATINSWYPDTFVVGSNGNKFPGNIDMGGGLSWVGNGDDSDRLRTSNTALTRYDENVGATGVTGRVYANGSSNSGGRRYFTLEMKGYDQVTIKALSHSSGGSEFTFEHATDPSIMSVTEPMPETLTEFTYFVEEDGLYKFYDPTGKLSVFQILKKKATYSDLTGSLDVTNAAGIPNDYDLVFTNQFGQDFIASKSSGSYSVSLPVGQSFVARLINAFGYKFSFSQISSSSFVFDDTITTLDAIVEAVKANVWDFGAEQLDANKYVDMLDVDTINSWYDPAFTVGNNGYNFPGNIDMGGGLSWVGNGDNSDRLRTSNTALTRYDENVGATGYTGRVYSNGSSNSGGRRFFTVTADEGDEITFHANTQGGGTYVFEHATDASIQSESGSLPTTIDSYTFIAKQSGAYKFYAGEDKLSVFRVEVSEPNYQTIYGTIDLSAAPDIPSNYELVFTSGQGKAVSVAPSNGFYNVSLPIGYDYEISLANANGYVLSVTNISVTDSTSEVNLAIIKTDVYKVSGSISGLGTDIDNLSLEFVSDPAANRIYVPVAVLDSSNGTYSVELEADIVYTINSTGVDDFTIDVTTLTIGAADQTQDLVFTAKPTYAVTIEAPYLTADQLAALSLTFTNFDDNSYVYTFSDVTTIALRDATYLISYGGLDAYPVELALTSNLKVDGAAVTKALNFKRVTNWSFDDKTIATSDAYYKGLQLTQVRNEVSKGHLSLGAGAEVKVPVEPNEKLIVSYYYAANFSINGGDAITTSSGSTSLIERAEYVYEGTEAGQVGITVAGTTYITNISVEEIVPYSEIITVGSDKDYQTVNEALDAIAKMVRTADQRVTVMIDPGNYEEMVVISSDNVTLKNASATPSIALKNKGVDIDDNAVRITSYYGYGYHYYSQGVDNKWNAEVLEVNKANGYRTNDNVSGTTKASYWNATLVVSADNFIAEDLIIENSFNQYISQKESEDVVVLGDGNKGVRPVAYGETSVQNRSFVERAAAIGIANGTDKVLLDKCRIVGRQDSFFGGINARVAVYRGKMMGAVDYIFGGMNATFYHTDFVLNTSDTAGDAAYITAAQQDSGRGYLMYECNVISSIPEVETASVYGAKPGYFGRPWRANTSEVVFYNTKIDASTYPGEEGNSLISPLGWTDSLGGQSPGMYEYGTVESATVDNSLNRAGWATLLTSPQLSDGTDITTLNFTKGDDGWDPFPSLRANDDSDGDSIVDLDEILNGTNPDDADTDGDGKNDAEEGLVDTDGDGIIDALESSITDDDGDGLANELDAGNDDPLSDSDGDGYLDYDEVTDNQSDPNDASSIPLDTDGDMVSDLNDDDDDNDGLTDAEEALIGSDPTLVDTDFDGINDPIDNCPTVSNPDQSDLDADGIGDVCEGVEGLTILAAQAVTPNGDGINDTWIVKNILNHPNSIVRVYNRWGEEVFAAQNYKNDWDGRHNKNRASRVPSSSYYYQIDLDGDGNVDDQGWIYVATN
jgi:gliding motility-associated-like protein